MRVLVIAVLRIINAHALQKLQCTLFPGGLIALPVDGHTLLHRGTDGLERVKRVIGILRNKSNTATAQFPPLLLGMLGNVAAVESNGARNDRRIVWQQADGGHGGGGLAGTGLANDGGHFARFYFKLNATYRFYLTMGGAVGNG